MRVGFVGKKCSYFVGFKFLSAQQTFWRQWILEKGERSKPFNAIVEKCLKSGIICLSKSIEFVKVKNLFRSEIFS